MLVVLQFDIAFTMLIHIGHDVTITIDAGLAYRDNVLTDWTTKFHAVEQRPLRCVFAVAKGIYQNGGFTKVWISMKTVFSPWIFVATAWYWWRISLMTRPPVLMEKYHPYICFGSTYVASIYVAYIHRGEGCYLVFKGIIFRFKFLMLITLACAAMTVIFFIITQVSEGHCHWGDYTLQVHSAFLTGIYGMWNLYVFTIIFLYAPSHKHNRDKTRDGQKTETLEMPESQETQLTDCKQGPTETYRITGKVAEE